MTGKQKKEKPLYNTWQNSVYVIKTAWEREKVVLLVVLAQILLAVAIPTVALFLPQTVVAQILSGVPMGTLVATVLCFTVVTTLLQAVKSYVDTSAQPKRIWLRLDICGDVLKKVMSTDFSNLEEKEFTDCKQKAQDQVGGNNTSTEQIYNCFTQLGTNVLGFVVYMLLLAAVNPLILLLTAATTVVGVILRQWANRWQFTYDKETAKHNKSRWYINNLGEDNNMAKDIRLFAMADWIKELYEANTRLVYHLVTRIQRKQLLADLVDCAASFLREGLAYGYLIWMVLFKDMPVDQFVLLFAAIGGFSGWIMGILNEYATLTMHSLNYCHVRKFLEYPDHFKKEDGEPIAPEKGKTYALELRDVNFRYKGADENILEHINLVIKPGERLAVVGLNGAGKTTLVKLLCGFFDPTEGEVLLNGTDIRRYNRKQYYTLFTAVFQEFNILPLTIAQNITQQWEDFETEKINHCLELADLRDKIESLPDKTESLLLKNIHDEAVAFSGGETQRLMLARALYKDSPILVLDEPTAALDPIAESKLYTHYSALSGGKTSLYISHRLASTRFCDRIVLIANKGIAECGTHDQLLEQGGKYAELFAIQSKYYKEGRVGEPE